MALRSKGVKFGYAGQTLQANNDKNAIHGKMEEGLERKKILPGDLAMKQRFWLT